MVSIMPVSSRYVLRLLKEYYRHENYQLPPCEWIGGGASHFDLSEPDLESEELENLMRGQEPEGQLGIELTFRAPQSLSSVWAVTGDRTLEREILNAQQTAVRRTVEYIERETAFTIVHGEEAANERSEIAGIVFPHFENRARKPDVHSHVALVPVTVRPDGSLGTLRTSELFEQQLKLGAVYHENLADALRAQLPKLPLTMVGDSFHVLPEFPSEKFQLIFSMRQHAMLRGLSMLGIEGPRADSLVKHAMRPLGEIPDLYAALRLRWREIAVESMDALRSVCNHQFKRSATLSSIVRDSVEFVTQSRQALHTISTAADQTKHDVRQLFAERQGTQRRGANDTKGDVGTELHKPLGGAEWRTDALRQLAIGDVRGALGQYAMAERLQLAHSRAAAATALVQQWMCSSEIDRGRDSILLASTQREASLLNHLAQQARRERGEVGQVFRVRVEDAYAYRGDRVVLVRDNKEEGYKMRDRGRIESIALDGITIRLDCPYAGRDQGPSTLLKIPRDRYTDVALGYAFDLARAEGFLAERGYILTRGRDEDWKSLFMQVSRATRDAHLFAPQHSVHEDVKTLYFQEANARRLMVRSDADEHQEEANETGQRRRSPSLKC